MREDGLCQHPKAPGSGGWERLREPLSPPCLALWCLPEEQPGRQRERERTGLGSEIIGKKSLTYRPPTPGGCRKPTTNLCALQPCVSEHMGVGVVSRADLPGAHSAACPWQAVSCQNSSSTFGRPISRELFGPAFQFVGGFRGMMQSAQQPPDQWQKMDSGALCLSLSLSLSGGSRISH